MLPPAPRAVSGDLADRDTPQVVAGPGESVFVMWVDDREGKLNVWARRSTDGGTTWQEEVRLSRTDREGFDVYYGDYGGLAVDDAGRLHAVWSEGRGRFMMGGRGEVVYARWTPPPLSRE